MNKLLDETKLTCDECGCIVDEDDAIEVDGEYYCRSCYDNQFVTCNRCGTAIREDDAETDNYNSYCQDCYDEHYTRCSECNEIIRRDNAYYHDDSDNPYCDSCYFDSAYGLDDFKLTRVDFTVNIDVGDRKTVLAYIKVLHSIGKVKGFDLKYDKTIDWVDKNLSFDLEGNSNGIEFTAYDKEAESKKEAAKGILRIEVKLTKQKAIKKYTDETVTSKQIAKLAKNSKDIFMETFVSVVPYGDFYRKKEAVAIVQGSSFKNKQKEKMLLLIELIPKKKSLLLAQKELDVRDMDKIMERFAEINLSPVTIGKRVGVRELKGLYGYF